MMRKKFFRLFANCIPVMGAKRSTVCDLQQNSYIFVDNWIGEVLTYNKNDSIESILLKMSGLKEEVLHDVFDNLKNLGFGLYLDSIDEFPPIDTNFEIPYLIQDCVVELSEFTSQNIDLILSSLTLLGCQALELRSYNVFDTQDLIKILEKLSKTRIRSVEVVTKYSEAHKSNYKEIVEKFQIINAIIIHSCENQLFERVGGTDLLFTKQKIDGNLCCGNISKNSYIINLPFYLQSLKANSCLYKKVAITENGSIKNCPSIKKIYGNINTNSIENIIKMADFQQLGQISKDKIEVCRDCEFRHICQDCRAFLDAPTQKPKKCFYDPYTTSYSDAIN